MDLEEERQFKFGEALEKAQELGFIDYIETSALNNINVEASFISIVRKILKLREETQKNRS